MIEVRKCRNPEICGEGSWHARGPVPGNHKTFGSFGEALGAAVAKADELARAAHRTQRVLVATPAGQVAYAARARRDAEIQGARAIAFDGASEEDLANSDLLAVYLDRGRTRAMDLAIAGALVEGVEIEYRYLEAGVLL